MWWVIKVFHLSEMFSHCEFKVYQSFAKNANKSFPPPSASNNFEAITAKKIVESFLSKVGTCCLLSKNIFVSQSIEFKHLNHIILKMSHFLYLYFLEPAFLFSTFSIYHTYVMTIFPSCIQFVLQFQILIVKTNISDLPM